MVAGCYCFRAFHVFIWLISVGWRGGVHHHLKSEIFLQLRIFCWCWLVSSHSPRSSNSPNGNSQLWSGHCGCLSRAVGIYGCPGRHRLQISGALWFRILDNSFHQTNVEPNWMSDLVTYFFAVIIKVGIDYKKVWLQGMVKLKTVHQSRLFYRVENHLAQLVTKSHLNRNRMNLSSCQDYRPAIIFTILLISYQISQLKRTRSTSYWIDGFETKIESLNFTILSLVKMPIKKFNF